MLIEKRKTYSAPVSDKKISHTKSRNWLELLYSDIDGVLNIAKKSLLWFRFDLNVAFATRKGFVLALWFHKYQKSTSMLASLETRYAE